MNKYCCIPFFVGETADTLNALRYCKDRGALIVGVTNTGTFTKKNHLHYKCFMSQVRHMGHVFVLSEMPCSPCLGHETPVMQAIHVVCIIPSAKAHRQCQQACIIVLLELHKVPTLFLSNAWFRFNL